MASPCSRSRALLIETAKGHAEEVLDAILDAAERWLLPRKRNTVK